MVYGPVAGIVSRFEPALKTGAELAVAQLAHEFTTGSGGTNAMALLEATLAGDTKTALRLQAELNADEDARRAARDKEYPRSEAAPWPIMPSR
jgi:hypothetical protein